MPTIVTGGAVVVNPNGSGTVTPGTGSVTSYSRVTVTDQLLAPDGSGAAAGTASVRAVSPTGGAVYDPNGSILAASSYELGPDDQGAWQIDVTPTDQLTPAGSWYEADRYAAGGGRDVAKFLVPSDTATVALKDVRVVDPAEAYVDGRVLALQAQVASLEAQVAELQGQA